MSPVAPRAEASSVCHLKGAAHIAFEFAGVVVVVERRLVRKRVRRNDIAPPKFDFVDAHLSSRLVDHPLNGESRLRPSGAAIGVGRRTVCEDADDIDMDSWGPVDPCYAAEITESGQRAEIAQIGAKACLFAHPQTKEGSLPIER